MSLWTRTLMWAVAGWSLAISGGPFPSLSAAQLPEASPATDPLRNENRIIRPEPSPLAARCGTAVAWVADWDEAVRQSRETGKPIFWYVPTIPGTFMDRKAEVDRYMLAGPFSNPRIIERLNREFIPTRGAPNQSLAKQFDLLPYNFVEPGFLVIDSQAQVLQRVDRLTTLHADWLARLMGVPKEQPPVIRELDSLSSAWDAFRDGATLEQLPEPEEGSDVAAETWLLKGMFAFRRGDHELARDYWRRAGRAQPESPLAWKAAAEAEGFGPFVRGFETWSRLPEGAWLAGRDSKGSAAAIRTSPS
ncbi:MAG: tetratricopeptide repeat protein [Planctomycetota bacterium]